MAQELENTLKTVFASHYAYYLKAQGCHWNVEGFLFPQLHSLFGTIYETVGDTQDAFAENLRKCGFFAPATFSELGEWSKLEPLAAVSASDMLRELYLDSVTLAALCGVAYEASDSAGEYGLANFLADQQDMFKKIGWMLRSSLK